MTLAPDRDPGPAPGRGFAGRGDAARGEAAAGSAGPGRPRVARLDDAILRAAIELLDAGEDVSVSKVVERSGVSRAALYRRWPSITHLIAAALDVGRTAYPPIAPDDDLRVALLRNFIPSQEPGVYPETRFRQRLKLVVANPELQQAYWKSHVERRRTPLEGSLRAAVDDGRLRADLDVSAAIDAMAGIVYYQFVVRGADLSAAETQRRMAAALDVVWRGMVSAEAGPHGRDLGAPSIHSSP